MTQVIIMRGISGSGKTTEANHWARIVPGAEIVSTDAYMYAGGREFDHTQLERCHEQCKTDYRALLVAKTPLVIVDNTNTKFSSIVPYVQMADELGYRFTVFQLHVDPKVAFERSVAQGPARDARGHGDPHVVRALALDVGRLVQRHSLAAGAVEAGSRYEGA